MGSAMGTLKSPSSAAMASGRPDAGAASQSPQSQCDIPQATTEIANAADRPPIPTKPHSTVHERAARRPSPPMSPNAESTAPQSTISTNPEPAPKEPAGSFEETESMHMAGYTAGHFNKCQSKGSASGAASPNARSSSSASVATTSLVGFDTAVSEELVKEDESEQSTLATQKLGGQLAHLKDNEDRGGAAGTANNLPGTPRTYAPPMSIAQMPATPQTEKAVQHGLKRKAAGADTGRFETPKKLMLSGFSNPVRSPSRGTEVASSVLSTPASPSVQHRRSKSSPALKKQSATPRKRRATKPWDSQTSVFKFEPSAPAFPQFAPPIYQQASGVGLPFGLTAMHSYRPIFCMACGSNAPGWHAAACPQVRVHSGWSQGHHGSPIMTESSPDTEAFQSSSPIGPAADVNSSSAADGNARVQDGGRQIGLGHSESSAHARLATAVTVETQQAPLSSSPRQQPLLGEDQTPYQSCLGTAHYRKPDEQTSSTQVTESPSTQMQRGIRYLEPLLGSEDGQTTPDWSTQQTHGVFWHPLCSASESNATNAPKTAVTASPDAPSHVRGSVQPSPISPHAQGVSFASAFDAVPAENDFASGGPATGQDEVDVFANVELSELDFSFLEGLDWDSLPGLEDHAVEGNGSGFNGL